MKNVLILSGSPKAKGNSGLLCEEFARGAEEAGCKVERFDVARMRIPGCLGCNACRRNGGKCVQRDGMDEIREAMFRSDVIVLASPIYFYSMTSQLKAVLDRTYAFERELEGKGFCYLVSCAAPDESYAGTMLSSLRGYVCCLPGSKELGYVIATGTGDEGALKGSGALERAFLLGRSLA